MANMKSLRKINFIFCLLGLFIVSCKNSTIEPVTQFVFGTVCTVNLFEEGTKDLYKEIFSKLNSIDNTFSVKKKKSEISKINSCAGKNKVEISQEVFELLEFSKYMASITDNAFNPTLGALINLWGIGSKNQRVPTDSEIEEAKQHCNPSMLNLFTENDKNSNTKYFAQILDEQTEIDLGGIVKGYATDEIVKILQSKNVKKAVIDLGGNIYVYGEKDDAQKWKVGIKNPLANFDKTMTEPILILTVESGSIVTSGNYERYFMKDDKIYHHIIDSKTGCPSENNLLSVTITYEKSVVCDALTTAYFVGGINSDYAEKMGLRNCNIIFIDENLEVFAREIK